MFSDRGAHRLSATPFRVLCGALLLLAAGRDALGQPGQPSEKERIIRRILEVTRTADAMLVTMEAALPTQRASNPNIPAVFWDRFIARARAERGALIDSIVPVYDRHFTVEELREVLRFYETPVGRRMMLAMPDIMRESMVVGQRWGFVIGQEIGEQLRKEGLVPRSP